MTVLAAPEIDAPKGARLPFRPVLLLRVPLPSVLSAWLLLQLSGCGARSQLDVEGMTSPVDASDRCPSAVSGPRPMANSCSTRDGRSRVSAPVAPHVTWSTKLPTEGSAYLGPGVLATDAAGHAYVLTIYQAGSNPAALLRVRTSDGAVEWTAPVDPDQETNVPIVLSHGGIDVFAYAPGDVDSMVTFDPSTGATTSTTFGLGLQGAVPDSAVGADGSLYITHEDGAAGAHAPTFVSRVSPGGDVLWTSVDFWTLIPPTTNPAGIEPSLVALAKDDLVVSAVQTPDDGAVVNAFDPTTGATRWSTTFNGALNGGPAIRPDGTIALLIATNLVLLDPETGAATATHPLPGAGAGIWAVTKGGTLIMGIMPPGLAVLTAAVDGAGTPLWTSQVLGYATLASDGTIVVLGVTTITALDGETGATKWELQAPQPGDPNACFIDAALASEGGLVALACDGTLLGVSD